MNSSKRVELKFGRAQFKQCHEMEVLQRAFQLVGFIITHFLCIHSSQESHWMDGSFLTGREQTPQGN